MPMLIAKKPWYGEISAHLNVDKIYSGIMNEIVNISLEEWQKLIQTLIPDFNVFAPVRKNGHIDYSLMDENTAGEIIYNTAKPASPLKIFFLPVKLNVTETADYSKPTLIIGVPACDVEGLKLLDAIYLDEKYPDNIYLERRNNTLIIASDCYQTMEHCHCTSYGINPYAEKGCDINLSMDNESVYLQPWSEKGRKFIEEHTPGHPDTAGGSEKTGKIAKKRESVIKALRSKNRKLPGTEETGARVEHPTVEIWKQYSSKCVSCGACSAICPTCTCFLLIDREGFGKVKQLDTCQYPAFERVAGGEDSLKEISARFKNRYMCKFIWKPRRFGTIACTGCGRCIEACIAKISKNELIMELS
jgi:sulfhydrogenase subunit beta (sulfur reductase)